VSQVQDALAFQEQRLSLAELDGRRGHQAETGVVMLVVVPVKESPSPGSSVEQAAEAIGESRFDHQTTAFPLAGLHLDLPCSTCHGGAGSLEGLRATPTGCFACHAGDDAHRGSLGSDCAACHTPAGWGTAQLDHNLTAFPLAGRHLDVASESCHIGGQLAGIPTLCVDCHRADDTHAGRFGTDCAACHPDGKKA
jgi:hypothetical protein